MATKTLTDSESMLISTVNAGGSTGYPVRMVKAKKRAAKLVTLGLIKIVDARRGPAYMITPAGLAIITAVSPSMQRHIDKIRNGMTFGEYYGIKK